MNAASRRFGSKLLVCAFLSITVRGNAATIKKPQKLRPKARTAPLFDFHSNFWVNLHQTLFHEALLSEGKPDRRLQSSTPLSASEMDEQEKTRWNAAIDFYANKFQDREELFDDEMVRINNSLAQQPDDGGSFGASDLPPGIASTLRNAAPIYRKYGWAVHNKSNQDWIASQRARVREFGPRLAGEMTKDLHQPWPAKPIRVDVCYYVPEIGHAYTTDNPSHTTFSSSAPSLQGLSGFEILFHEASHTFADTMMNALSAECRAQQKNCSDLWHAVLFYTSGVELRRLLPAAEQTGFTPYAYKYGVYTRGDWPKYRRVLETDWQKYLDGKINFTTAIHAMVTDLR